MKKRNVFTSFGESIVAQVERLSNIAASLGFEIQAGGAGSNIGKPPFIGLSAGASSFGKRSAPEIVVGLDIGTTKIVAIAGRMNKFQKVEVIGFSETVSEGVMRGKILNIAKTTASVKFVLEELSRQIDMEIDIVTVNISGNVKTLFQKGIFTTIDFGKEIQNEDIRKLRKQISQQLLPPGETIIYTQIQEFEVDGLKAIIDPLGMIGSRLEADFKIISSPAISVKNVYKCVENSGHKIQHIWPAPLACGESVLSEDEKEEGVALIDIGGSTTDIIIYKNKIMRHMEVIPLGGNSITQDIKYWSGLSFKQAELLKKELGTVLAETINDNELITVTSFQGKRKMNLSRKNLAHVIQARVEELLTFVINSIKSSGYEHDLHCGIVLTGGTALLPGIKDIIKEMTRLSCQIGLPDLYLSPNKILAPDIYQKLLSPPYSTAIGLVKIGLANKLSGDVL